MHARAGARGHDRHDDADEVMATGASNHQPLRLLSCSRRTATARSGMKIASTKII